MKPKVSAFINAKFDKIEALRPDFVLAFSDLPADLGAELVRRGIAVVTFNQRSVAEILQMIVMLGGLVEELVEIAGGAPTFPQLAHAGLARDRSVDPGEVARRDPQVVFASWCGKKMKKSTIQEGSRAATR